MTWPSGSSSTDCQESPIDSSSGMPSRSASVRSPSAWVAAPGRPLARPRAGRCPGRRPPGGSRPAEPAPETWMEATRAWEWAPGVPSDQGREVSLVHLVVSRAIAPGQARDATGPTPTSWPSPCGQTFWPGPMCPTGKLALAGNGVGSRSVNLTSAPSRTQPPLSSAKARSLPQQDGLVAVAYHQQGQLPHPRAAALFRLGRVARRSPRRTSLPCHGRPGLLQPARGE